MATMQVNLPQSPSRVSPYSHPGYPYPQGHYYYYSHPQQTTPAGYHLPVTPPPSDTRTRVVESVSFDDGPDPIVPHEHDILMGRGGKNNMHVGNQQLRKMAREMRDDYMAGSKKEKSAMSRELTHKVFALSPPARFLKRENVTAAWEVVDEGSAREKTSQCLRDAVTSCMASKMDKATNSNPKGVKATIVVSPKSSRAATPVFSSEETEILFQPSFKRQRIGTWEPDNTSSLDSTELDAAVMEFIHTIPIDDTAQDIPVWDLFNFSYDSLMGAEDKSESADDEEGMDPFGTDFF